MSVFSITQLVAADYHGKVPSDRLLATWIDPDPTDTDGDGVVDEEDLCPGQIGDAAHCGCPDNLVTSSGNQYTGYTCTLLIDPDQGGNLNDSTGVPVGGGLLLLLGSALAYGVTRRKSNKENEEK
ncbi:hypothetical protein FACS189429_7350 [Bacteroidia bacterium]|nr:hypothetical protein FACS189429_7350 [Bacteroidia bacterium]